MFSDIKWQIYKNFKIQLVDAEEFAEWFAKVDNRRIDYTEISEDVFVSTVFLGGLFFPGCPENKDRFETMVMGGEFNGSGWRFNTLEEAKKGHWEIVDSIKQGKKPCVKFGERPPLEILIEMLRSIEKNED